MNERGFSDEEAFRKKAWDACPPVPWDNAVQRGNKRPAMPEDPMVGRKGGAAGCGVPSEEGRKGAVQG